MSSLSPSSVTRAILTAMAAGGALTAACRRCFRGPMVLRAAGLSCVLSVLKQEYREDREGSS